MLIAYIYNYQIILEIREAKLSLIQVSTSFEFCSTVQVLEMCIESRQLNTNTKLS